MPDFIDRRLGRAVAVSCAASELICRGTAWSDRIPPRLDGTDSEHSFGLITELGKHSDLPGVYAG
jgi:hypothetical protein